LLVLFEAFGALLGYFWGWGGAQEDFWGSLVKTNNFHFVRLFLFSKFFIFFFWVGVMVEVAVGL